MNICHLERVTYPNTLRGVKEISYTAFFDLSIVTQM